MADVFVSYAEEDSTLAHQIITALRVNGILAAPARPPDQPPNVKVVARELTSAKCVIVLWSDHSVRQESVLAEADYAARRKILVSAVTGTPRLSMRYRDVVFADLTHWTGKPTSTTFQPLTRLIDECLQRGASLRSEAPEDGAWSTKLEQPDAHTNSGVLKSSSGRARTIFLCYRREDTQDAAGRLHDHLVDAYGSEGVFIDIDSLPLGIDFVEHVAEQISRCRAVIVMIGRQWLKLKDKRRRRRLDNDDDLVRVEIAAALKQRIPVIPVLVQDVPMPDQESLPENIRPLARRNGIALSATRWRTDVERLIKELDRVMKA